MRSLSLGQALEDQTLQRSHQGLDGHQKHQSIQEERQEAHLEEAHQFVLAQLRKSAGPPFSRPVPLHCWLKHKRRLLGVDPKDLALKNHHLERVEVLQNSDVLHAEAAQAPAAKLWILQDPHHLLAWSTMLITRWISMGSCGGASGRAAGRRES